MRGHGEKLTRKQEQAVAALLVAPTIHEAATQANISEVTLHRWLKMDGFQHAYARARREVVRQAIIHLQATCHSAIATLQAVMNDTTAPASSRIAAARIILEHALKGTEWEELEARIRLLEAQFREEPPL